MIKQYLHKVFSITVALLVLVSTVSFTVEKRYCHDDLIDVAVFTTMDDCCPSLQIELPAIVSKKGCCKDEVEILKGQTVLKNPGFDDLDLQQQIFLATYVYSYLNLFEGLPKHIVPHADYSPPDLVIDRQIIDQTFLI